MMANIPDMASFPKIAVAAWVCSSSDIFPIASLKKSMVSLRDFMLPSSFCKALLYSLTFCVVPSCNCVRVSFALASSVCFISNVAAAFEASVDSAPYFDTASLYACCALSAASDAFCTLSICLSTFA